MTTSVEEIDLSSRAIERFLAEALENVRGDAEIIADTASEALLAIEMLSPLRLATDTRVLEVGAGAGVVSAFLRQQGATVTAIEPDVGKYADRYGGIREQISSRWPTDLLPIAASELGTASHGTFDLIFSVNVLEHMQPLQANLDGMARVLAVGGRMVHTCPNYRIPYEPHVCLPIVPFWPRFTERLVPRVKADPEWPTLNFITAGDIRRFAKRNALELHFRPGEVAASLARLRTDEAFARRQSSIARIAGWPPVTRALTALPPAWATPMTVELARSALP